MNQRGLSTIITTLIIILMVLVAIGIVWYAVLPMIKGSSQKVSYANECMGVDFKTTLGTCTPTNTGTTEVPILVYSCGVTIKREPTSASTVVAGIELVFTDATSANEEIAYYGDDIITEKSVTSDTGLVGSDDEALGKFAFLPSKISRVRAYFIDENNEKYFCTATTQ